MDSIFEIIRLWDPPVMEETKPEAYNRAEYKVLATEEESKWTYRNPERTHTTESVFKRCYGVQGVPIGNSHGVEPSYKGSYERAPISFPPMSGYYAEPGGDKICPHTDHTEGVLLPNKNGDDFSILTLLFENRKITPQE